MVVGVSAGGAGREGGGGPQVGPARDGGGGRGRRHELLRGRRRAALDLAVDAAAAQPALRGGGRGRRGRRVAPAAGPLVVAPLQQHVAGVGARGGRVGGVAMSVVPRRAPGSGRLRRRRARPRGLRGGVRLGGGEVGGQPGTVGGGVVVFEGGSRRRLAGHAAASAVREREAVRAESLVPATATRISDFGPD